MSLDRFRTGEKPSRSLIGEGRREGVGQQSASPQRSGGVSVDSTSVSLARESWESSSAGGNPKAAEQGSQAPETGADAGAVGVLHSSLDVDLQYCERRREPREDTYSKRGSEAKDAGMAGATRIVTPDKVRELQIALYRKAKTAPKHRFWSLYGEMLREDVLGAALGMQLDKGGAAGVDGETVESVKADPARRRRWLEQLREELKTKTYRPSPVRRVMIPKRNGGKRPLGIPTVKDRVVQTAVYLLLMPIWEADFHPHSYGFRPKRRTHQAIDAINQAVRDGYVEIIDADLTKYFDTIPHLELMKAVARRVSDGSVLRLIKSWLRAPVVEEDKAGKRRVQPNLSGTPQGGVISPLLANIYLNPLDHAVNEQTQRQARMVRYADDFVIACRAGSSTGLLARLKRWLAAKGLTLNETKTRGLNIRQEGMNFLGFHLDWRRGFKGWGYLHVEPSQASRKALRQRLREVFNHWTQGQRIKDVVAEANRVLRGWAGYFHYGNSTKMMKSLQEYSRTRPRRWLWRKQACQRRLWHDYPDEQLHEHYGLYRLPTTAGWKAR